MAARKRGIGSIEDLYARSERRPGSSCWWWMGAVDKHSGGGARLWSFDFDAGEKRSMSGARAVYGILHGVAPPAGKIAAMRCCNRLCVNPAHNWIAGSRAEIGAAIAEAGTRKGKNRAALLASLAKGRKSQGIVDTPSEIVRAIRQAPKTITSRSLAQQFSVGEGTVSKIRRGISHVGVAA